MITATEGLILAARDLFLQAYGNKRYGSHMPTRVQWLNLGAALKEAGASVPEDYIHVFGGITADDAPARET